ncbi:MAG: hypothetical protein GY730_09650 [bacterium]|nr:hypothetical protein [bacterium]
MIIAHTTLVLIYLIFALLILYSGRKNIVSASCFAGLIATVLWMLNGFCFPYFFSWYQSIWFFRMAFCSGAVIPAAVLIYAYHYPNKPSNFSFSYIIIYFFIPFIIMVMSLTPFLVKESAGKDLVMNKAGHFIFTSYFIIYMIVVFVTFVRVLGETKGADKLRLKYLISTLLASVLMIIITNLIFPLTGDREYIMMGPFFPSLFIITLFYVNPGNRLRDINVIFINFISILFLAVFFLLPGIIYYFLSTAFINFNKNTFHILAMVYGVFVCFFYQRIFIKSKKIFSSLLLKEQREYSELLAYFTQKSASCSSIKELFSVVDIFLKEDTGIESVRFYRPENYNLDIQRKDDFVLWNAQFGLPESGEKEHRKIIERLKKISEIQYIEDAENTIKDDLLKSDTTVYIPCLIEGKLFCMLLLGQKTKSNAYTSDDFNLFDMISYQIAFALERILPYEKTKIDYHKSLAITEKMAKEASYATLTLSIAHEIETPLGVILSGIERVIENIDTRDIVIKYSEQVKQSIIRLSNITTTTLQYGKSISCKRENVSVNKILSDIIILASGECQKRDIEVDLITRDISSIIGDTDSLSQVFLNIILNAAQAIDYHGEIEIITGNCIFIDNNGVEVKGIEVIVKDNGCGIACNDIEEIFNPFWTTKSKNIGLGLSTSLRIINDHNGVIMVESEQGRGSEFIIKLPEG